MLVFFLFIARGGAFVSVRPGPTGVVGLSATVAWDDMYEELVTYRREWGTADAPLGNELGRWCQTQRRLRSHDKLEAAKIDQLDAVGFSWVSPSAPEDVETDWDERVVELAAYSTSHGDGQVPKKYKANPRLGGWVAAVRRRGRGAFATTQLAQLEEAGFEWISIRRCGSQFMKYWRELRDFHASHGHAEPPLGSPLRAWCDAQRRAAAKGLLSSERLDYLRSLDLDVDSTPS